MFTVAIVGADGAGKSTVIEGLQQSSPYPIHHIYMGVNPDALTHMLPTTHLVNYLRRRRQDISNTPPKDAITGARVTTNSKKRKRGILSSGKSLLFIANRLAEVWYRQIVCWYYVWQGYIVLFDRHFYLDHLAYDFAHPDAERPFLRRVYNRILDKTYPRPDLTIYLDAPADVLFARKKEGTLENLRQMRDAYLKIEQRVPAFCVVDAMQSPEAVLQAVLNRIKLHHETLQKHKVQPGYH